MSRQPGPTGSGRISAALGATDPRMRRNQETDPAPDQQYGQGLTVNTRRQLAVAIGAGLRFDARGRISLTPSDPPVVTGSLSDGTATASLIEALVVLGLVVDNTSA